MSHLPDGDRRSDSAELSATCSDYTRNSYVHRENGYLYQATCMKGRSRIFIALMACYSKV